MNTQEFEKQTLEQLLIDLKDINNYKSFRKGAFIYDLGYYKGRLLIDELERYKNIIEKAITFINIFQDEKTLTLNYDDLRHLRGILKGNDFDLMILEDKLKELKGSDE